MNFRRENSKKEFLVLIFFKKFLAGKFEFCESNFGAKFKILEKLKLYEGRDNDVINCLT